MPAILGVPKEIKQDEGRVAISPNGVHVLVEEGHRVLIERSAGYESGITDDEFEEAGAEIVENAREIWANAQIIVKVKEPLAAEYDLIRPGQVVFTFFHFAASRELTDAMIESGATCIAYETIKDDGGRLPVLTPMSEVAGRMSVFEGSKHLESPFGGRGVLVSGVPGVEPAKVVVIGGGVVGSNAARIAAGVGAQVTIFDIQLERLRYLADIMPPNVTTLYSSPLMIREKVRQADLVVGAVLVAGERAPVLVSRELVASMKHRSVIVDVAVDQGGCVETCRPTTHSAPTYVVDGVVHYCVANMPGAVARTSTYALTNTTIPYLRVLAAKGLGGFLALGEGPRDGLNVHAGKVYHEGVAKAFGLELADVARLSAGD
ncbi:MAG TPA: alanine dehydrogenase [Planctomycetota bacterium]|nr:alanine dehydrogenase [Planctomycetota bacterium]